MLVLPVQYLPTDARMSAGLDTPEPVVAGVPAQSAQSGSMDVDGGIAHKYKQRPPPFRGGMGQVQRSCVRANSWRERGRPSHSWQEPIDWLRSA